MKSLQLTTLLLLASLLTLAQPKFIAHRGASYYAPENTLAAIELAWELGADGAECDIHLTKDNQLVLWHDTNTERMTGTKLDVAKATYSELKKLEIKLRPTNSSYFEGQRICLLKNVFRTMGNNQLLVIESKIGKEIVPQLQKVVGKHWKNGKIAFISFNFEGICATKSAFPEVPCYWLSSNKEEVVKKIQEIKNNKLDGVDLNSKIIDEKLVSQLRKANLDVWCWTVDDATEAKRMTDLSVNVITTNRPTWLKENLDHQ
ncbi:MAG TPA: glycerophosphodiester phosphodiesterase family protein [Prolixibacteraceae bacterium]|nr:glycerophosphodiester phosphodiesterase family protein [Prolixibacteraceae bacterium]